MTDDALHDLLREIANVSPEPSGECPSRNQLVSYATDQFSEEVAVKFQKHLASCTSCLDSILEVCELQKKLCERGVDETSAREVLQQYPSESIALQIEVLDWLRHAQPRKAPQDGGKHLIQAIQGGSRPPAGFRKVHPSPKLSSPTKLVGVAMGMLLLSATGLIFSLYTKATAEAQKLREHAESLSQRVAAQATSLQQLVAAMGLKDPIRLPGGQPLDASSVSSAINALNHDQIAVNVEINKAFIKTVSVRWREGEPFHTLYEGDVRPYEPDLKTINSVSPSLTGTGGFQYITVVLKFMPYQEVLDDLGPFFQKDQIEFKRTFLLTHPYGLITDPPPGLTETRIMRVDADNEFDKKAEPNRYLVHGRALPNPNAPSFGYLVIESTTSEMTFIGAKVRLDDKDPSFAARCHLGEVRLDNQLYFIYLIVANRPVPDELEVGRAYHIPDWGQLGYTKATPKVQKRNDGKSCKDASNCL